MPVTELYAFNLICENLLAALYGVALTNKMKKLINDLGITNIISTDDVISIIDMGLYIEGIAVSINNYNSIRLYFNRIPGQRRKKGHEM